MVLGFAADAQALDWRFAPSVGVSATYSDNANQSRSNPEDELSLTATRIDHLVAAAEEMARGRIGALIAIEREIGTLAVQETGTRLDSLVSADLLATLFYPRTALHDGGVVIEGDRVRAAGCVFPLSTRDIGKTGTRHRAAVGLSEETDAVVLVVSEETGAISLAYKGRLIRGLDEERLRRILSSVLMRGTQTTQGRWQRLRRNLDLSAAGLARTEELMEREFEEPPKNP